MIWYVLAFLAGFLARAIVVTRRQYVRRSKRLRDRKDHLIQITTGPWRKPRRK